MFRIGILTETGIEPPGRLVGQIRWDSRALPFHPQPAPRPPAGPSSSFSLAVVVAIYEASPSHLPRFLLVCQCVSGHTGHSYGIVSSGSCSQRRALPCLRTALLAGSTPAAGRGRA